MKQIDIALARERLTYDPETGVFVWRVSSRGHRKAGDLAGTTNKLGYRFIKIDQVKHLAHRLAWAMHFGVQSEKEIDHINGVRDDNRIINLREASRRQQCQNRGVSGVRYEADRNQWLARISIDGVETNLGRYDTEAEAKAVRDAFTRLCFGEFARG